MLVIATNTLSINAHRSAKNSSALQQKANTRLSTGYRINSASDDAAGLAISEKMRAQIRSLNQSSRNSQDGISLIQTAEGGMAEIGEMLARIRELTIQAANDTNATADREKIQTEIDQLVSEIDGVTQKVEFNGMKLLKGRTSLSDLETEMLEFLYGTWIEDGLNAIEQQIGLTFGEDVTLNVEFVDENTSAIASMTSDPFSDTYTLKINKKYLNQAVGDCSSNDNSGPVIGGIFTDRVIAHEMTHALMRNAAEGMVIPQWFTEGLAEAINGASDTRLGANVSASYYESRVSAEVASFPGDPYAAGYIAVMYMDRYGGYSASGGGVGALMQNIKTAASFEDAVQATFGVNSASIISSMQAEATSNISAFISAAGLDVSSGDTSKALKNYSGDNKTIIPNINGGEVIDKTNTITMSDGYIMTINWPDKGGDLYLKTGANENQALYVTINSMTASSLGVNDIDVVSLQSASKTIGQVDGAVEKVNRERARLGAYQNRLEHTVKNLDISSLNLTSSESRIRDTDMAKEMMQSVKSNILSQASISMLANANQAPQNVLQLIR